MAFFFLTRMHLIPARAADVALTAQKDKFLKRVLFPLSYGDY
jgi:hypothetical protein